MPEDLPTTKKRLKQLEKENNKTLKPKIRFLIITNQGRYNFLTYLFNYTIFIIEYFRIV